MLSSVISSKETIVITGCSGWLGRAALEFLFNNLNKKFDDVVVAFSSTDKEIRLSSGKIVYARDLRNLLEMPKSKRYILVHYAFLTKDKIKNVGIKNYIEKNSIIKNYVSEFINTHDVKTLIYTSSGAVYSDNENSCSMMETNPYGYLKAEDEMFFSKMLYLGKVDKLIIPRVFNLGGPYFNNWEHYALSSFVMQASINGKIKISAQNKVFRSYIHVEELTKLLFTLAFFYDRNKIMFDTKGTQIVELSDLAYMVKKNFSDIGVVVEYNSFTLEDRYYSSDATQDIILKELGQTISGINQIIQDTIQYAKSITSNV
jgi:nucleoside-diphosphate-sugar epimerase